MRTQDNSPKGGTQDKSPKGKGKVPQEDGEEKESYEIRKRDNMSNGHDRAICSNHWIRIRGEARIRVFHESVIFNHWLM